MSNESRRQRWIDLAVWILVAAAMLYCAWRAGMAGVRLRRPVMARPLKFQTIGDAITALAIFALVWIWMRRRPNTRPSRLTLWFFRPRQWTDPVDDSRDWGDPLLLVPVIVLGICIVLRPLISWQMPLPDPAQMSAIDLHVASVGWWVFALLEFLSAVCLARILPRPVRAPICALVAAIFAWLNPAAIMGSSGNPRWDAWLAPFFLVAAVLVSLDWWMLAGAVLGVGCALRGELLLVAPVLVLCPLLAGWPERFLRLAAAMAAAAGFIAWPSLITGAPAMTWFGVFIAVAAAIFAMAILPASRRESMKHSLRMLWINRSATWRRPIRKSAPWIGAIVVGVGIICLLWRWPLAVLLGLAIVIVPWFLQRRQLALWLLVVFAAALWLAAFHAGSIDRLSIFDGRTTVDADTASNLWSILDQRYNLQLHDPVEARSSVDLKQLCRLIYFACIGLCAVGAAMHLRRHDSRFLIALAAPWVLLVTLETQVGADQMMLPAMIASMLIAISVELSLLPLLLTVLVCAMIGNQNLLGNAIASPVALSLTRPMQPDIGWAMLLVAAIFLVLAMIPTRQARARIEVV